MGFRLCFWMHFPLIQDYSGGTSFCFTAGCLRVMTWLWKQWRAIRWAWFPYKAESACVLTGFKVKLMFSGKLEGLFFLKSDSISQTPMDGNDFDNLSLYFLNHSKSMAYVKCELLAVLIKLKGSILFIPSRKTDLLFLAYQKLGLKCGQSQARLFPSVIQTAPPSWGPGQCDIRWYLSHHHKQKWKDMCHGRKAFWVAFGTWSKRKALRLLKRSSLTWCCLWFLYQLQGDCVLLQFSPLIFLALEPPAFIHICIRCVASGNHFTSLRLLEDSEFGPSHDRWKQTLSEHKDDIQKDFEVLCLCHFGGCALLGFSDQVLPVNSWKQKLIVERSGKHELILKKFWEKLCNARDRSVQPFLV